MCICNGYVLVLRKFHHKIYTPYYILAIILWIITSCSLSWSPALCSIFSLIVFETWILERNIWLLGFNSSIFQNGVLYWLSIFFISTFHCHRMLFWIVIRWIWRDERGLKVFVFFLTGRAYNIGTGAVLVFPCIAFFTISSDPILFQRWSPVMFRGSYLNQILKYIYDDIAEEIIL